ncbi:YybH family protein [Halodurantibacterium flavum]|uniref:YybH family protein n=1 Tax=Halodurantibacterium flavum TaxID=1382802 RepID=A0ABW4S9Q4_9RHOB
MTTIKSAANRAAQAAPQSQTLALPATPDAFAKAFSDAFTARDAGRMAALFVPEADFITPEHGWWEGAQAIAEGHEEGFATVWRKARLVTGKARVRDLAPGLVQVWQRYILSGLLRADGTEAPRRAVIYGFVLRKTRSGWQALSAQAVHGAD